MVGVVGVVGVVGTAGFETTRPFSSWPLPRDWPRPVARLSTGTMVTGASGSTFASGETGTTAGATTLARACGPLGRWLTEMRTVPPMCVGTRMGATEAGMLIRIGCVATFADGGVSASVSFGETDVIVSRGRQR